jgi:ribosomal protein L21E
MFLFAYKGRLSSDISIVLLTIGSELLIFSVAYFLYNAISYLIVACQKRMSRKLIWDIDNGVIVDPETKEVMFNFKFYGMIGIFYDNKTKAFLCIYNGSNDKYIDQYGNVITMNQLDKEWQKQKHAIVQ